MPDVPKENDNTTTDLLNQGNGDMIEHATDIGARQEHGTVPVAEVDAVSHLRYHGVASDINQNPKTISGE